MRRTLSLVAAALVAALAALILGEYEFTGYVPFAAGVAVGLLVAETVASLGRWRGWLPAGAAALLAALSAVWAGWIDSDEGVEPFPELAWLAAALAVVVAVLRLRPVSSTARAPTGDGAAPAGGAADH